MRKIPTQLGGKVLLWIMAISLVGISIVASFEIYEWFWWVAGISILVSWTQYYYLRAYGRIKVKAQAMPQATGLIGMISTVVILVGSYVLKLNGLACWSHFSALGISTGIMTLMLMFMFYLLTEPVDLGD